MSLINIGVSGLRVQQSALRVTGQNITNAATPGYSRQRVDVVAAHAGTDGARFRGAGALVQDVSRVTDQFLVAQVRTDASMQAELAEFSRKVQGVDGLLLREAAGLDGAFDAFFDALNDANAAPDAQAERALVLQAGQTLAERFATLGQEFDASLRAVDATLEQSVARINEIANGIAELNQRLASLDEAGISGAANPLRDQRDQLLEELSTFVAVDAVEQDGDQVNVFIGKGQALVLGALQQTLRFAGEGTILLQADNGAAQAITSALGGGEIGGALAFRDTVLLPAMQRLGRLAQSFSQRFNEEHRNGVDLRGQAGGLFFSELNGTGQVRDRVRREDLDPAASGSVAVFIEDPQATRLSDYRLSFAEQDPGAFIVTRIADGTVVAQGRHTGAAQALAFDGVRIELGAGNFGAGQRYVLSPLTRGAGDLRMALTSPGELALASAVRTRADVGNAGTAQLRIAGVEAPDHPLLASPGQLLPPLLVRFVSADRFDLLDNSDPTAPVHLDPPLRSLRVDADGNIATALTLPGSTRIDSTAPGTGVVQEPVSGSATGALPANGYGAQTLTVRQGPEQETTVALPAGASAAATAELLDRLAGVSATAVSDVFLSQLSPGIGGTGPDVQLGSETLRDVRDLDALVRAVNANETLRRQGYRAVREGDVVRLTQLAGEDIGLRLSGPAGAGLTVAGDSGAPQRLIGSGAGEPAALTAANDLRGGYDFQIGGPYAATVTAGGQTAQVVLDQAHGRRRGPRRRSAGAAGRGAGRGYRAGVSDRFGTAALRDARRRTGRVAQHRAKRCPHISHRAGCGDGPGHGAHPGHDHRRARDVVARARRHRDGHARGSVPRAADGRAGRSGLRLHDRRHAGRRRRGDDRFQRRWGARQSQRAGTRGPAGCDARRRSTAYGVAGLCGTRPVRRR